MNISMTVLEIFKTVDSNITVLANVIFAIIFSPDIDNNAGDVIKHINENSEKKYCSSISTGIISSTPRFFIIIAVFCFYK